jgi:hypothetical protein
MLMAMAKTKHWCCCCCGGWAVRQGVQATTRSGEVYVQKAAKTVTFASQEAGGTSLVLRQHRRYCYYFF